MSAVQFRRVGLFVDWNTQIREAPVEFGDQPVEKCRFALKRVGKIVAKQLCNLDSSSVFRVQMRLYHGWTSGVTQTVNRRAFERIAEFSDPDELFPSTRVRQYWLRRGDDMYATRILDNAYWPIVEKALADNDLLRIEQRQASGTDARFIHVRQAEDILSENPTDVDVRKMYGSLISELRNVQ